jgi:hypothetical protein
MPWFVEVLWALSVSQMDHECAGDDADCMDPYG